MISTQDKYALTAYLNHTQREYLSFMGVAALPDIQRNPIELTIAGANAKGYGSWATVFYEPETDKYRLDVWKDIYKPQLCADYILYHEYTHAYDIERLAKSNKLKYAQVKGYIEYHAAQVELIKQLGASTIQDELSFSMNGVIKCISGSKSVIDVLRIGKKSETDLIQRGDFPTDLEMLVTTMGMVFNHLGRASVCKMYASDYEQYSGELEDYTVEESLFGSDAWKIIISLMKGFMNDKAIDMEMKCHLEIMVTLMKKYGIE